MLRQRKNKRYNEETHNDQDDGGRTYNLREKIRSPRFEQLHDLQVLSGDAVSIKLIQQNGFDKPILVETPAGLDIQVPPKNFLVRDIAKRVGQDRIIDVMDVRTQKNIQMTMKEWCRYFESRQRDRLLNVISLEFSHTDLAELVESPKTVRQLDWVDLVWPKFLKESQTESTNTIDKMKYPKVQKYCLMSVKGSYTDFHIDFGGTSVWYHILWGKKMFWMCPPTELNLQAFEEWTLSGMQQDVFFGDTVEECFRVELSAGNTFFIPSGWIHAVYTMDDSLVFGGNFLHSFGIENQLKVSRIEDATKVPHKFRYPFYTEIQWYVVQHYVYCLTGKSHLHSTPATPEKSAQKPRDKQVLNSAHTGETTESDQDDSDSKKQVTPPKRKRGRPPKSVAARKQAKKPPTDDESTEIDSDLEEAKPTKSTATCRMTKNSLLRLQYEIEDSAQKKAEASSSENDAKTTKSSQTPGLDTSAAEARLSQAQITATESDKKNLSQLILSQDNARTNGWSTTNHATGHQQIWANRESEPKEPPRIHITKYEVNGLRLLVKHLSKLSGAKKNLPALIRNSRYLLDDCRKIIVEHENDNPELAATGVPIGPEVLNPKKSDINQLIEQFFKPSDAIASDHATAFDSSMSIKSKSDSSTLTQQQRLKYMQSSLETKGSEKKNLPSTPAADVKAHGSCSPNKDSKNVTSPSKKFSTSLSPSLAACAAATTVNSSVDQPRPKSPPTRPLSNKQYTNKTKKDNSLVLPGSFADLIAATSTAKEVFDVSSAEVTSSLFGAKPASPQKITQQASKTSDKSNTSIDASTKSKNDHDQKSPATAIPSAKSQSPAPKPNSPEPPKMQPPKRFINPAYRPQNKEKLIFASAPYVSPAHNNDHSKNSQPFSWQSPVQPRPTQHPSHSLPQSHQRTDQQSTQPGSQLAPCNQGPSLNYTAASEAVKPAMSVIQQAPVRTDGHRSVTDKLDVSIRPISPSKVHAKPNREKQHAFAQDQNLMDRQVESKSSPNDTMQNKDNSKTPPAHASINLVSSGGPSQDAAASSKKAPSFTISNLMVPSVDNPDLDKPKKPTKPRGPPKKSKEARQVLESDAASSTIAPISVPVIVTAQQQQQQPPTKQSGTGKVVTIQAPVNSVDTNKPKNKKAKKQKDGHDDGAKSLTDKSIPVNQTQVRPQVICGIVNPQRVSGATTTTTSSANPGTPQQYLISRPLMFNSMPTFCSTQMPPQLTQSGMPIFTTPVATSMGLSAMQPGARIVWATRPPVSSMATTTTAASSVKTTTSQASTQAKSRVSDPKSKPTVQQKPQEHAALLSLATTALSTAPLPTTPTLSHMSSCGSTATQALMVNPMVAGQSALALAGQHYYNPFLAQMPIVARPQMILGGAPNQALNVAQASKANNMPRPTGQLLFAPMAGQTGQPRYLITQPGFLAHRPPVPPMFAAHPTPTTLAFAAYRPQTVVNTAKAEQVKVKKVKTR